MARKPARKTESSAAKAVADKYIAPKGGKKAPAKTAEDYELSAATIAKGKGRPPPEIRIVEVRAKPPKITDKEALFIELYACDPSCRFNGAEAARQAGYPPKAARQTAYELLTKPYIQAAIEIAKREQLARVQIDSDHLLLNLVDDMRADIAELFDDKGALKPIDEWPLPFRTGLVAGFDIEEIWAGEGEARVKIGETKKVKLADRIAIKKLVGQHINIQAWNHRRPKQDDQADALTELMREIGGKSFTPRPQLDMAPAPGQPGTFRPKE